MTDNPRAFPLDVTNDMGGYVNEGMTLRDYFAGQALVAISTWIPDPKDDSTEIEHHYGDLRSPQALKLRAEWAYAQADAMLKERSK